MPAPQGIPTRAVVPGASSARGEDHADRGEPAELDWVAALSVPGPEREAALRQLHGLMVRAASHQVWRMRGALPDVGAALRDDIAHGAADEALTALLGKLSTFEGRSRFTTWAYKFAILQAATEVRRYAWAGREVALEDVAPSWGAGTNSSASSWGQHTASPEQQAEASDLAAAVSRAMVEVLTPYQRKIAVALLLDGVPVDVLAERLGTSRGALYKTLHMARGRLRGELVASGHLPEPLSQGPAGPVAEGAGT